MKATNMCSNFGGLRCSPPCKGTILMAFRAFWEDLMEKKEEADIYDPSLPQ